MQKRRHLNIVLRVTPRGSHKLGECSTELHPSLQERADLPKDATNTPQTSKASPLRTLDSLHGLRSFIFKAFACLYSKNNFPWCF